MLSQWRSWNPSKTVPVIICLLINCFQGLKPRPVDSFILSVSSVLSVCCVETGCCTQRSGRVQQLGVVSFAASTKSQADVIEPVCVMDRDGTDLSIHSLIRFSVCQWGAVISECLFSSLEAASRYLAIIHLPCSPPNVPAHSPLLYFL